MEPFSFFAIICTAKKLESKTNSCTVRILIIYEPIVFYASFRITEVLFLQKIQREILTFSISKLHGWIILFNLLLSIYKFLLRYKHYNSNPLFTFSIKIILVM